MFVKINCINCRGLYLSSFIGKKKKNKIKVKGTYILMIQKECMLPISLVALVKGAQTLYI